MYEYRVIPFIGQVKAGDKHGASTVATQLQAMIAEQAAQGWELVQVANVQIQVAPGCLAGLSGAKVAYVGFDQVIFRRAKS